MISTTRIKGIVLVIMLFLLALFASGGIKVGQNPSIDYLPGIRAIDGFEQPTSPYDNFTMYGTDKMFSTTFNPLTGSYSLYQNLSNSPILYPNKIFGPAVLEIMFYDTLYGGYNVMSYFTDNGYSGEIGIDSNNYGNFFFRNNTGSYDSGVARTQAWHNFTLYVDTYPRIHMYIDGVLLDSQISSTGNIDQVVIGEGGYAGTFIFYWDDFSIREPNTKSPLFYITETSTLTNTVTDTLTDTVTNTLTNTVTSNQTVTDTVSSTITDTTTSTVTQNVTFSDIITSSETKTETVTGNVTETETSLQTVPTTQNVTFFDTTLVNHTTTSVSTATTTEYASSSTPTGPELPSFSLSPDFMLGMASSLAIMVAIFIARRFY